MPPGNGNESGGKARRTPEPSSQIGAGFGGDQAAQVDADPGNDFRKALAEGVTADPVEGGGVWLQSESWTGNLDQAEWDEGLSTLQLFALHRERFAEGVASADGATESADRVATDIAAFDEPSFDADADAVQDDIDVAERIAAEWTGDDDAAAERFWWVRDASGTSDDHEALDRAIRDAMLAIGPRMRLPADPSLRHFPADAVDASEEVRDRKEELSVFLGFATSLFATAGEKLPTRLESGADVASHEVYTTYFEGRGDHEQTYLLEALSRTSANTQAVARFAAFMRLQLPSGVIAAFDPAEQEVLLDAWNNKDIQDFSDEDRSDQLGRYQVIDLLTWEDKAATGDVGLADLEKFERFLTNAVYGNVRFQVPDLGGHGLSHALAVFNKLREAAKDGDYLTARSMKGQAQAALDEVIATHGGIEGAAPVVARIRAHRDDIDDLLGVDAAADAMIGSYSTGDDVDLESVGEQATFQAVKTAAVNAKKAYWEMAGKVADATGKALDPSAFSDTPTMELDEVTGAAPRADSMPTSFGKVGIATILFLSEASSYQEQLAAIQADPSMSEGDRRAEQTLAGVKFTKALCETIATFMEGMMMWASRYLAARGATVAAAEAARWAKEFSAGAGKVFALAGLCIAAVDLVRAIRSGDEERIAEAGAGVAQAGIGVAGAFGVVGAAGSLFLNVLVVEAVGAYYICKNLPKIAEKAHHIELAENSQSVVDHTRAGMRAAKRAEAAGNAWQAAMMAGDPKLAAVLERKMGTAIVDSWNEIVQASTFALDAPGGVDEAFRAHVGFTDLVANQPPKDLTGADLHLFAAGYEDFLQRFRYGVEDMTDKAMLATGNVGFIEYVSKQQQRREARSTG